MTEIHRYKYEAIDPDYDGEWVRYDDHLELEAGMFQSMGAMTIELVELRRKNRELSKRVAESEIRSSSLQGQRDATHEIAVKKTIGRHGELEAKNEMLLKRVAELEALTSD